MGIIVAAELLLRRTRTGHKLPAIGTNETATTFSGVNIPFFRLWVYGLPGMLSSAFAALPLG